VSSAIRSSAIRAAALRRGWFPVARAVDLDRPRQVTLLGRRLVVFRTAQGQPCVLADRCLHRGGALHLGAVIDESIECPYHGWRWRGSDGRCVYIPSNGSAAPIPKAALISAFPVVERFALIWTCVGDPLAGPPELPELDSLGMTYLAGEPVEVSAGILAAMENFRDVAHFPFVHRATMGQVPHAVARFDVRREGHQTWMTRSYSAAHGEAELFRDVENLTFNYHARAPAIATVMVDDGVGGRRVVIEAFAPAGPTGCTIFLVSGTAADYTACDPAATLATEMQVLYEDLPTLNTLDPLEVPFDREHYELSVEADRYSLATRRAFVEFIRDAGDASSDSGTDVTGNGAVGAEVAGMESVGTAAVGARSS
jgi:phenylpropionate dioxygenase-like ring-hydroxylating dioxygenase large terminal subunit